MGIRVVVFGEVWRYESMEYAMDRGVRTRLHLTYGYDLDYI
ncbi:predicted protein [Sclerotinia sclerotiorum 1980 UF-70]|uniref:Uncharacterized protein n=1 Tax=Sclerotinia sclerotiorum (strain ATCC 18683 / 1980 / Ss-1) TaxID=665079 RepID=A7E9S8_SCLS1|nr:predicted protein [Sclerotinia sclerotiorum 1980 UF-70]EDN97130.1 predicted protein [Sclerotinia sclerotiorum 1980 UF-70]